MYLVVPDEGRRGMIFIELVVEESPVVLTLDLLSSLPQGDGSLGSCILLRLGAQTSPPVDEGLLQFVDTPVGDGLGSEGGVGG